MTYGSDIVSVDASHTSDGYVMLRYTGSNEKVKLQVTLPDGTEYTYPVTDSDTDSVYPLPGGSGSYKITLLESVPKKAVWPIRYRVVKVHEIRCLLSVA